ncbi:Ger(x)C family spore germination protein [Alicyclobacillus ferrooxydans]|uniref:Uncharacterized protein n=1 Tax=Alicyclobacillus ferrooxydans TaxID=471514 RepID=A0A0P9EP98_9BACL|nr:Ger(x)C family spore germination protein [Alicyclobacillus ferrooxydans]KPV45307.1 hypothetical protein AN477_02790 [Alicyclobacillus ferrooxydans]
MRFHRWLLCLWLGLTPLLLSGCYDRKELEQQAFVTVLGIDKGPSGTIDCTFELATPQSPGGGGPASTSTQSGKRVAVRAHSIAEALTVANASVERTLSFTHLTLIMFGQALAQDDLAGLTQSLIRFREFRGTILLAVTKGTAQGTMTAFEPVLEQSPSRAAESIALVGQQIGIIPLTYLHDFTRQLSTQHTGMVVPLYAVNDNAKQDPSGEQPIPETAHPQLNAGSLPRTGGNPVEWSGAAVFRGAKMVDTLNGEQMRDVLLLQGKIKRTLITFHDPVDKQAYIGMSVHAEEAPIYQVRLTKPVQIQVQVPLEADIQNTQSGVDYTNPSMRARLEKDVDQQLNSEFSAVLKQLLTKDDADVIPVSNRIRSKFATHQAFAAYPWEQQLTNAQISVSTDLHIRRFGIQTSPIKPNA